MGHIPGGFWCIKPSVGALEARQRRKRCCFLISKSPWKRWEKTSSIHICICCVCIYVSTYLYIFFDISFYTVWMGMKGLMWFRTAYLFAGITMGDTCGQKSDVLQPNWNRGRVNIHKRSHGKLTILTWLQPMNPWNGCVKNNRPQLE